MCEIACKNSKRLLSKRQKNITGYFLPHTVHHMVGPSCGISSVRHKITVWRTCRLAWNVEEFRWNNGIIHGVQQQHRNVYLTHNNINTNWIYSAAVTGSQLIGFYQKNLALGLTSLIKTFIKQHVLVWLAPKSTTLDDPERSLCTLLHKTCVFQSPPRKFEWK